MVINLRVQEFNVDVAVIWKCAGGQKSGEGQGAVRLNM